MLNNKNNEIRGVNDQMRAVIVDGQLKTYNKLNPHLQGTGHISYLQNSKDEEYTIFLYEDKNKSVESFARKNFGRTKEENNKKK